MRSSSGGYNQAPDFKGWLKLKIKKGKRQKINENWGERAKNKEEKGERQQVRRKRGENKEGKGEKLKGKGGNQGVKAKN